MTWSLEDGMVVRRTGEGRELVWIHGLGEQSASFDRVVALLPGYQHVLVDLPGYGRAPWPAEPASLAAVADRLAAWIGDRRPILAGHSQGGVLAHWIAERIPTAAVIDIEGNLSRGDCTLSARAAAFTLADFIAHGFDTIRDEIYKRGIADEALRGYYAALRMTSPQVLHRHATELVALSSAETRVRRLAALAVPVLFIAGVPEGVCERTRALLDAHRVQWVAIEPSGHWPFVDQPQAFATAVANFCQRLSSS
jgi:pimeloyl-ACP methyl ester carboxylesterase